MEAARDRGAHLFCVCNVQGSQATRISEGVIYTHAGPEIGVASTKAFTTQVVALYLLALYLRQERGGDRPGGNSRPGSAGGPGGRPAADSAAGSVLTRRAKTEPSIPFEIQVLVPLMT